VNEDGIHYASIQMTNHVNFILEKKIFFNFSKNMLSKRLCISSCKYSNVIFKRFLFNYYKTLYTRWHVWSFKYLKFICKS